MNIATQEKEEAQARSSSMMASSSLLSMFVLNEYRRILVQNKQQTNNIEISQNICCANHSAQSMIKSLIFPNQQS